MDEKPDAERHRSEKNSAKNGFDMPKIVPGVPGAPGAPAGNRPPNTPQQHRTRVDGRASAEMEAKWLDIKQNLKENLGSAIYNHYIRGLSLVSFVQGKVTLSTASSLSREHVMSNQHERIKLLWRQAEPSVRAVDIILEPEGNAQRATLMQVQPPMPNRSVTPRNTKPRSDAGGKLAGQGHASVPGAAATPLSGTTPNPHYTFENFVRGTPNELACATARLVAAEPGKRNSALYIHAASGLGKSHILHAIGNAIAEQHPQLKLGYLPANTFMNQYAQSSRDNETNAFREFIRSFDVLLVDDLQFICGRDKTVNEFAQTFNAFQQPGKQIVIAADRPAGELEGLENHVRSRLSSSVTVAIGPPDLPLRLAILQRKLEDMRKIGRAVDVPEAVLEFIAHKIESNPRELEGALACVANNSEVGGGATSVERAQELVRHLIRSPERRITIDDIQKKVAAYYHVSMRDLLSHRRDRAIVRPRQVAMYLSKELTTRSLPEIGRRFGGRDHTTVLYGVRRIGSMMEKDPPLSEEVELLKRMIEN